MNAFIYHDLHQIDYEEALTIQTNKFNALLEAKANGEPCKNELLFCEHNPVLTIGKSGKDSNLLISEARLKELGVTFFHINRGGDITYHGPGQITGYPIFHVSKSKIG